ncbi:MAG TPA: DinB family protein [Tepidisphaeraceae bacterium]|nr:DinB family protein [Tepidisphaeraceae bacterium]
MDIPTLLASMDFTRSRLLAILSTIEKSGQDLQKVFAWRPGPGRAHMGWQFMHCAATLDRYVNVNVLGGKPKDESLVAGYAGGTTPSDQNIPTLETIKQKLESSYAQYRAFVESRTPKDLATMFGPEGRQRLLGDTIVLLAWHEAHHQGQIHLTWNLYKAAHGIA